VLAGFIPGEYSEYGRELFPVVCLCIASRGKFSTPLTHRDYLGAVLNLGIARPMIGDIRIAENRAFMFCKNEIAPFIQEQLSMVGHTAVSCQMVQNTDDIPQQQYEIFSRSIASARLDNVVAAMTGKARGKAAELITQGKVVVDSTERSTVSYICKDGSIISIRGYGKFRLEIPEFSLTRKGKQKIQIYKYK
jgi:RNA-binding protein YlmH